MGRGGGFFSSSKCLFTDIKLFVSRELLNPTSRGVDSDKGVKVLTNSRMVFCGRLQLHPLRFETPSHGKKHCRNEGLTSVLGCVLLYDPLIVK